MDYYRVQTSDETLAPIGADNNSLNIACDSYAPDYWNNTYVNGLSPMKQIEGLFNSSHHFKIRSTQRKVFSPALNFKRRRFIPNSIGHLRLFPLFFNLRLSHCTVFQTLNLQSEIIQMQNKKDDNNRDCKPSTSASPCTLHEAHMLQFISRSIGSPST